MGHGSNLEEQRRQEQAYWDNARAEKGHTVVIPAHVEAKELRPCFEGDGDLYSENRMFFHTMLDGRWNNKYVLDYACGQGNWAIYFALTGARKVVGFDLSPVGIEIGMKTVREQDLIDKVTLVQMDATNLKFPDDEFELVIGNGVLHHTIKYDGIFENLHRVMKPGSSAYFLENLADFPLWRLWWRIKGQVPEGDVPIFSKEVKEKAHMFSKVEIIGDTFFHSIKTVVYKRHGMTPIRRRILRFSYGIDQILFKLIPSLRAWGSFSVIILTK